MIFINRTVAALVIPGLVVHLLQKVLPPVRRDDDDLLDDPVNHKITDDFRGDDLVNETGEKVLWEKARKRVRKTIYKYIPLIAGITCTFFLLAEKEFHEESVEFLLKISKIKVNLEKLGIREQEVIKFVEDLKMQDKSDILQTKIIEDNLRR